jgi:cyclopropane fatty-acyl-phospholipid synthase-like methyltransferase
MKAAITSVHPPTPYHDNAFDMIVSISVFTHLNEQSQDEFLSELHRISGPNAYLFLTVHGETALTRALQEDAIRAMLAVDTQLFLEAQEKFWKGKYAFILQQGHLTVNSDEKEEMESGKIINEPFEYGITFIPEQYIRSHWSQWFEICDYRHGALHSFQDIVVLSPKKK